MIYIFDKKQTIIKVLTNEDLTAGHLDLKINTATTFEFSLPANKPLPSNAKYVAVPHPLNSTKFILLRLTERTDNADAIDYSAYELAYQELATDGYIADKRPANQDALTLMKTALNGSNWELNNVNVAGTASTNFYYIDHLTAISKVVELLGGEIVFYVEIQGNTISGRYMDYLARQGEDTSKVFAKGSNLLTIERQSDTSGIYTAILPRGKGVETDGDNNGSTPDGYGRRLNIADAVWKKSDGKPLNKPAGEIILYDPTANAEWGQIDGNYRLLLKTYDDVDDVNTLINSAYKTLQSVNHPKIQYSATVADVGGLSLGDTVLIMHGDRNLSYKTRVFKVNYDLLDPAQTEISLGDDLSSNDITSQINNLNVVAGTTSSQTQWTINQIGRPGTTYGAIAPDSPKVGDIWFKYLAEGGTEIYRWNGYIWELLASLTTADDIATAVDDAVAQANTHTDEVKQGLSTDIDTAKSWATSQANTAEANAESEATSQFNQAQSALSEAKTDLTNSIASEASARTQAVATVNSQAQSYATQAKADAISAASSADGVIRTAISSSADSLSATITQNKSSADSGISTAQTTAQAAVDGLMLKVSKTDYDQKTGDLSTKINDVKETADSSAQTIADIQEADGKQDTRMAEIEKTAGGIKSTVSDLSTAQGKQSGDISTLQQRADSFDATVTKVDNLAIGGRNYVKNSSGLNGSSTVRPTLIGTSSGANATVTYPSDGILMTNGATNTTSEWYYQVASAWTKFSDTPLTPGKQITFSADVMGTVPQAVLRYGFNGGTGGTEVFKSFDINNTSWKRVSITVASNSTNTGLYFRIQGGMNNQYVNGWIGGEMLKFRYVKIEDGNVPTDWSPAPEDLSGATAKAQLTADKANLDLSTYKTALAQVKITADGINNFVRDSSGNISSGFQTALSKTSIITGSTLATSIQKQTSSQITSALTDNNGKIISLINQDTSGVQIAGKNITLDGNTTVTGDFYAKGGNFKNLNASNFTTGTINAAKINVINLDVSSLSGNITNFIKSYWNNAYSNVSIDGNGMSIRAGQKRTDFKNGAINIQTQRGENLGFLGTANLTKDDTVDYLTLALNGYHTTNQGDSHYDPSSKDFYGGDGISFDVSNSKGNYEPVMRWNSRYAADIIGTHPGWQMLDHVFFEKGIFAHSARDNFKVGWTSWSDWGNYHTISLTNQNGSAGIAVSGDNLVLFAPNKRAEANTGWNV